MKTAQTDEANALTPTDEANALTPGQAWEQYVGSQSVAEWLANDGPWDTDGIEDYLEQAWPRDTTGATRPIIARRLARYIEQG